MDKNMESFKLWDQSKYKTFYYYFHYFLEKKKLLCPSIMSSVIPYPPFLTFQHFTPFSVNHCHFIPRILTIWHFNLFLAKSVYFTLFILTLQHIILFWAKLVPLHSTPNMSFKFWRKNSVANLFKAIRSIDFWF